MGININRKRFKQPFALNDSKYAVDSVISGEEADVKEQIRQRG